jgi:hypothetical protein
VSTDLREEVAGLELAEVGVTLHAGGSYTFGTSAEGRLADCGGEGTGVTIKRR